MSFDKIYWTKKYTDNITNWDIGYISPPIRAYIDQLNDKSIKILIPGAGNGYEAEYLYKKGFKNVYVLEFVEEAMNNFLTRVPSFPESNIFLQDFFKHEGQYDMIIEQTFFCSLAPQQRAAYVEKVFHLLRENGKFLGLLFDIDFKSKNPPFGGDEVTYTALLKEKFEIEILETAYNSIKPRANNELFIKAFVKK